MIVILRRSFTATYIIAHTKMMMAASIAADAIVIISSSCQVACVATRSE
jgi:hypothetical protein